MIRAKDIMTREVITVHLDTEIIQAAKLTQVHGLKNIYVHSRVVALPGPRV